MEPVVPFEFRGDLRNLPQLTPSSLTRPRPTLPVRHAPPSNRTFGAPPTLGAQQGPPPANILVPLTPAPSTTQNFPGLSSSDLCGSPAPTTPCGGGIPPDTNGDVGPNHYIEAVNTAYAIYSKTGTLLVALTEDQLWSASGSTTPCGNGNAAGDPVVVYDPIGDRWILTHIGSAFSASQAPTPPFYECIAVSKTGDPVAGGWWFYPLRMDPGGTGAPPMGTFNDYPKFGIWTDCLYMSANGFNGTAFTGVMYASMSRSDLESGATLTWSLGFLSNTANPSPFTMIPSNLRGAAPPAGTPNYFVSESQIASFAFDVRKFSPGPNCGGNGTLSGPTNVSQQSYSAPPAVSVPQPGTLQLLDAIDDRLMQKVQYRRVGNTESLWVVHNVISAMNGPVQPQWAQIDVTGGTIATMPVQQQIYAPDNTLNRWMGSIAADKQGNVALGYSTSNGTAPNFPSIAYAGRLVTDPLSTLGSETQLIAGSGSQTGIARWGDYTGMSVDPSDDCTFWYANEYYSGSANGANRDWQTRIGSFKFPSCTAATVVLSPTSVAFSNQLVGTTSATGNVQLTNSGSSPLNITSITLTGSDSAQFALVAPTSGSPCSLTASTINAGSSCSLGVQFKPTSAGSKIADVSVSDNASGSPQTVGLTGVATLPAPAVAFSPASVAFSNQLVGTASATSNVQLTNSGTATLNITAITLAGTNPSQFALVAPTSGSPVCSQGASSLNTGSSCFLGVRFAPTSAGSESASLSVTDDAAGSPQTITLSGTGAAPAVTLSQTSVSFSSQAVGTRSATTNVQLTNSGTATLNITSIALTGTDSSQFALVAPTSGSPQCSLGASSINAASSCFLGIQFAPMSAGSESASISVTDDAAGSPQAITLSGTGVAPKATLSPTTLTFSSQTVGGTSGTSNIQLTNSGTDILNITSITLTGADLSQFALVASTSGSPQCSFAVSSLNAGSSCFLGVQFAPTTAGGKSASVSVVDNVSGSPQVVILSGTGLGPTLTLSQTAVAFGDTNLGLTSATTNMQLTNSGTATLNITSITLTGANSSQFALVAPSSGSPACSLGASSINAGSSCFVGVQFTPTVTGQHSASVSVADNAPAAPQITSLSGIGVDFNVAAAPPTMMTVAAGANAGFTIDLTTTGGPTENTVTFSASGNPAGTSVTFAPPSVPSGTASSSTPIAMTITTTRRSSGWPTSLPFDSPPRPRLLLHFGLCLAVGSTLLLLKPSRLKQRKLIGVSFLGVVLLACAALQGCASTGNAAGMGTPGGTPAGTSTITVTATSGSISRTTTVMLTVQ